MPAVGEQKEKFGELQEWGGVQGFLFGEEF